MLKPLFNRRLGAGIVQNLGRNGVLRSSTLHGTQFRYLNSNSVVRGFLVASPTRQALQKQSSRIYGRSLFATQTSSENVDKKLEEKLDRKELKADPENVSTTSTVREVFEEDPAQAEGKDPDMAGGLRSDVNMIKQTFALREVPREVLVFGLAGLVPYVSTTVTTLFLAWDLNNIHTVGRSYIFTENTAEALLGSLEPIQVGFGAIILSFLGAIHWGLEFAGYGGHAPYRRYFLGILAPALAWPTILMPVDYALLAQFLGFTGMYFADAQATSKGWAPKWYSTYRFILTFIVGACIVGTLIGRGEMGDKIAPHMPAPAKRVSGQSTTKGDTHNFQMKSESKDVKIVDKHENDEDEEGEEGEEKGKGQDSKKNGSEDGENSEDEKSDDEKSKDGKSKDGKSDDEKSEDKKPKGKDKKDKKPKDDSSKDTQTEDQTSDKDSGSDKEEKPKTSKGSKDDKPGDKKKSDKSKSDKDKKNDKSSNQEDDSKKDESDDDEGDKGDEGDDGDGANKKDESEGNEKPDKKDDTKKGKTAKGKGGEDGEGNENKDDKPKGKDNKKK